MNKKLRNKVIILTVLTAFLTAGLITADRFIIIDPLLISIVSFFLLTIIVAVGSINTLKKTFESIRKLQLKPECLNGLAIIALYFYSFSLTLFPNLLISISRSTNYIVIASIILLLNILSLYKDIVEKKYRESMHTFNLKHPETVFVLRDNNFIEIKFEKLKIGDIIEVKSGEMVAADGIVIEGNTLVNESMTEKKVGDEITEGTKNMENRILIKVTQTGEDASISQINSILKESAHHLGKNQVKTKTIKKTTTLIVLILAFIAAILWNLKYDSFHSSILIFTSTLLIASPENFKSIIEKYYQFGINKTTQQGIFYKGGEVIEKLKEVKRIIINKTGIITASKPEITNIIPKVGYNEKRFLILVAALESHSPHPFAEAITRFCKEHGITIKKIKDYRFFEGHGIIGTVDNQEIIIGNLKLMKDSNVQMIDELINKAEVMSRNIKSPVFIARNRELIGLIGIADNISNHSKEGIHYLNKNFKVTLITGDNQTITQAIANELRIKEFIGELKHSEKSQIVKKYQENNEVVASIGHGLKDKEILNASDIGIALGASINIGDLKNDITIIQNDLKKIQTVFKNAEIITNYSDKTIIVLGLYHAILIPIAAGVFAPITGLILHPIAAVGLHILSYIAINQYYSKFKTNF